MIQEGLFILNLITPKIVNYLLPHLPQTIEHYNILNFKNILSQRLIPIFYTKY